MWSKEKAWYARAADTVAVAEADRYAQGAIDALKEVQS
jgi:hypothetical protein